MKRLFSAGMSLIGMRPIFFLALLSTLFSLASAAPTERLAGFQAAQEILFIESDLPDLESLKQGRRPGMDVVVLDARLDGLQQMALSMKGRRGVQAVHLITHGSSGQLSLGAMTLDQKSLERRIEDVASIRLALANDADILIYACEVALGQTGEDLVNRLAELTGARVAAATHVVGSQPQGRNWVLDFETRPVRSAGLEYPAYAYSLPSVAGTFTPNTSASQPTPGTSAMMYYDGLLGTTDIPNIEYDLYYSTILMPAVPSGYVAPYVATTPPGAIFTHTDNSTASSDNGVGQLVIKSHDGTLFKLAQFVWQDPNGCNSTYTAVAYRNGLSQGSYQFNVSQSGTFSGTFAPGTFFDNINEVRFTAVAGGTGVCGDMIMGEGIANIVFADAINADATLSTLSLSSGTLSPGFSSSTVSYSTSVPNSTASITVTPTTTNGAATVKVNGISVSSGSASGAINLNVGSNTITINSKSSDGSTTKTYTITITRAASSVATLSSLALSSGSLSPAFASGTTSYAASVPNATTSITLTPTVTDTTATVKVNGATVASGSASGNISLNVGSNTVTTVVTAEDGVTTQTYTLTVTRTGSSIATLTNLALSSGSLSPTFASGTTSYTASVPNATTSITLTPTVTDTTATIKVNGATVTSGSASGSIGLNVGSNTLTALVTAQDGITTQTYTVVVTRAASSVATLSSLTLSSGTLTPTFASGTTSYTASVPNATTSITLTPTVTDTTATIKVNGATVASGSTSGSINLNVGNNTLTTLVTAQDGITTQTYTVVVTRAASSVATLSSLTLSSGTLTPTFASGTTSYTASVPNATTSITLTPTVTDVTATIKVNGTTVTSGSASGSIGLNVGNNTLTTLVTAQDGITTQTYTLTVTRADVTGQCGPAQNQSSPFQPSGGGLCTQGTATSVTQSGTNWVWSCQGGAGNASCTAPLQSTGTNTGKGSASVASATGWRIDTNNSAGFIRVSGDPKSPNTAPPAGYTFPQGLLDLQLTAGTAGTSATVTITYPSNIPANAEYWKWGKSPDGFNCAGAACTSSHWYKLPQTSYAISGNTITLTLIDGQVGDNDLNPNSVIVDPGGPAIPPGNDALGIPTLSEWAAIALASAMGLLGLTRVRRRPPSRRTVH